MVYKPDTPTHALIIAPIKLKWNFVLIGMALLGDRSYLQPYWRPSNISRNSTRKTRSATPCCGTRGRRKTVWRETRTRNCRREIPWTRSPEAVTKATNRQRRVPKNCSTQEFLYCYQVYVKVSCFRKRIDGWLRKREFVLKELVDTEEAYVQHLRELVDDYIKTMRDPESDIPMPDDLRNGKDKMVFGNVEAIYEWHQK